MRIFFVIWIERVCDAIVPEPFSLTWIIFPIIIRIELAKYLHRCHHCCHKFHTWEMFFFSPFFDQVGTMYATHSIDFIDEFIEIRLYATTSISNHKRRPLGIVQDSTNRSVGSVFELFYSESCSQFTIECMILMMLFFPCLEWCLPEITMDDNSETVRMHKDVPPAEFP